MPVISWLLQPVMATAAIIAGWIVAEDAANFGVVQMAISVLLITAVVAVITFWKPLVSWFKGLRR